jgi:hypothetical protein
MGWAQQIAIKALSVIVGAAGNPQIIIQSSAGTGQIQITSGSASFNGGIIEGGVTGSPPFSFLALLGPQSVNASHDDYMEETFNSANSSGTSTANIGWFYVDASGGVTQVGTLNLTDWTMAGNLHVGNELFGTGGTLFIGDSVQIGGLSLTVNGSSHTTTNGVSSPGTVGTSGPASAGTAHTHSAGSYSLGSGQHQHSSFGG